MSGQSGGIESVVIYLLQTNGIFYASLLSQMKRSESKSMPTLGVGIQNGRILLDYNPEFVNKFPLKQRRGLLEHECMHLVMEHISRKGGREHTLWNIATDLAINQLIKDLPKDGVFLNKFPKKWKLPPNDTAENYYSILKKHQKQIKITINQGKGEGQGDGTAKVEVFDSNGNKVGEFEIDKPGSHKKWKKGDNPDTMKEVLKQAIQKAVNETQKSSQRGELPAGLEEYIEELLKPPVIPWQVLLKRFVATTIKAGHKMSWKRPSRRFGEEQKGRIPSRKLALTVAIDTSGSIGEDEFQKFIVEIQGIQRSYKSDVTVLECDADVQKEYKLKSWSKVDTKFKGRGGTSFVPIFEYIKKERIKTDVLIYFTDMYGDFPRFPPRYPTLWVSTTDIDKAPFGKVLQINKQEATSPSDL